MGTWFKKDSDSDTTLSLTTTCAVCAQTGRIEWKFNPFREAMVSCSLVVSPNPPKPRRGGGWALYDDEVKAVVFGSSPGGMFALSTKV
jgi:hypothetical protein